jgi:DNA helicase IV
MEPNLIAAAVASLQNQGISAWATGSDLLPDIVVADRLYGVMCLDVATSNSSQEIVANLNKTRNNRAANFYREMGIRADSLKLKYPLLQLPPVQDNQRIKVSLPKPSESPTEFHTELSKRIAVRFTKRIHVPLVSTRSISPDKAQSRENAQIRIELDATQSAIASQAGSGVSLVTGVAGSGKTLVLAARARYLHEMHPTWIINIVCYNNALKPYLEKLVPASPKIVVETFYEFTSRNVEKFRMKNSSEVQAMKELAAILHITKNSDAILVDEAQDFKKGWLLYLAQKVRLDRGGVMVAGDESQSIYRRSDLLSEIRDLNPTVFRLDKSYRSTHEILSFINVLVPEYSMSTHDAMSHGPVPDLVWADGGVSKIHIKRAIALDIAKILSEDKDAGLKDIAILSTRKFAMKATVREIGESLREIVNFDQRDLISPLFDTKTYEPELNTVKMITIQSAKGLEFKYVLLMGLEEIAKEMIDFPTETDQVDDFLESKLNFVGPTRASHKLIVYYSKSNFFLERLIKDKSSYNQLNYPEDYEVPTKWQI